MPSPVTVLLIVCLLAFAVPTLMLTTKYFAWLAKANPVFPDPEVPGLVHEPKGTWLTGFSFDIHGIPHTSKLHCPVYLDYDTAQYLGKFGVSKDITMGPRPVELDGVPFEKDLVKYEFGVIIYQRVGGVLDIETEYNRISVTNIAPIIEEKACV